jgi:PIN domain nuclease of toxin-antitoxin system
MSMASIVLDASAILAVVHGEPGSDQVVPIMGGSLVSAVNYAEVATKLIDRGFSREAARQVMIGLGVRVADFDRDLADRTGELRVLTRHRGLSLGDRACLALAEREAAVVLTADRKWRDVVPNLEIRVVR